MKMLKSMYALSPMIAKARKEKGMTQAALAQAIGVSRKTVSEMESGDIRKVALGTVVEALRAVNYRIDVGPNVPPDAEELLRMSYARRLNKNNSEAA